MLTDIQRQDTSAWYWFYQMSRINVRNSELDNTLRRTKIQWYYQRISADRSMIYQEQRVCNYRKQLCLISHVNESMSSQAEVCTTRFQNELSELCESHQVWLSWVCEIKSKKLEDSSSRLMKISLKRSLNRCKSICIFMNRYQKHTLAVTEYSATSLLI